MPGPGGVQPVGVLHDNDDDTDVTPFIRPSRLHRARPKKTDALSVKDECVIPVT